MEGEKAGGVSRSRKSTVRAISWQSRLLLKLVPESDWHSRRMSRTANWAARPGGPDVRIAERRDYIQRRALPCGTNRAATVMSYLSIRMRVQASKAWISVRSLLPGETGIATSGWRVCED